MPTFNIRDCLCLDSQGSRTWGKGSHGIILSGGTRVRGRRSEAGKDRETLQGCVIKVATVKGNLLPNLVELKLQEAAKTVQRKREDLATRFNIPFVKGWPH